MEPMQQLLEIMQQLRDPQSGCPWDLRQTYRSILPFTLEEAYEVADAIERGDMAELRDELGDLLFQVVFYSEIAREEGHFDFNDVARGICDKMIRRHPHVFADARYHSEEALRHAWEGQKEHERAQRNPDARSSQMDGVAQALPALIRAEKLQRRAARVGFDWADVRGALEKVREEFDEVGEALQQADPDALQDELGDLMFAMVNVLRLSGLDAEQTLSRANRKFERRFRAMENILRDQQITQLSSLSLEQLDAAWERVKSAERDC
ncbi:MAG: nucleoside triphosphate pyrophosphohydrolase [Candidatus Thiodiazotropha sp.]